MTLFDNGVLHYLIVRVECCLMSKLYYMVNDRSSIGRSPQLDGPQGLMIRLNNSMYSHTVRILGVAIQSKRMRHSVSNLPTKTKGRKQLVTAWEEKTTNCVQNF